MFLLPLCPFPCHLFYLYLVFLALALVRVPALGHVPALDHVPDAGPVPYLARAPCPGVCCGRDYDHVPYYAPHPCSIIAEQNRRNVS